MGLDLALGLLVLATAVRGYLRGFVLQAIRLGGLVLCVYAADPVRDLAKPEVLPYLPSIKPALVDRGLWWASAILSYVVLVGLATLAVKLYRRQPYGLDEANRNDQLAGAMLGLAKGLVVAAFLASAIDTYALKSFKRMPSWVDAQAKESTALAWNQQYRPAARIWGSDPVRHYVSHVKRMGLNPPGTKADKVEETPVKTASRTPRLELSSPENSGIDPEVLEAVEAIKEELHKVETPN